VAQHLDLGTGDQQKLDEVVGEGVVVVDDEDARHSCGVAHRASSCSASASAASIAAALLSVSRCSLAGSESATMPAPAATATSPPRTSRVRMVMQVSMSPPKET